MTAPTIDAIGVLRCANNGAHRLLVGQVREEMVATCVECHESTVVGSTAWYDNHENLALLIGWQNDHDRTRFLTSILEKPWKFEDEFLAAKACLDHEHATNHQVNRDPDGDCLWYCNDCPRRHGYEHECCHHDDPSVRQGICCVCDAESPCEREQERAAVEDRDPELVHA